MSEFHEAFWVAVAAAAPVVLLAYVIPIGRLAVVFTYTLERLPRRASTRERRSMRVVRVLTCGTLLLGIFGSALAFSAFAFALDSLSKQKDTHAVAHSTDRLVVSALLVVLQAILLSALRATLELRPRKPPVDLVV